MSDHHQHHGPDHVAQPGGGTNVIDPVCGMTVDPATSKHRSEHSGAVVHFCSASCKAKFDAEPVKYLRASPASAAGSGHEARATASGHGACCATKPAPPAAPAPVGGTKWTCPMHPEVESDRPGACPKCGMALEPALPLAPVTKTEWTCPMHPEIVRAEPGACPICGMAL